MKVTLALVLILWCLMLVSCVYVAPSCHRRFNTYRNPTRDTDAVINLRSDGIYVSEESNCLFYFTSDGLVKSYHNVIAEKPKQTFWNSPELIMNRIRNNDDFDRREYWGAYELEGHNVRIQHFNYHSNEFCKRSVFEYIGTMLSDTAFVITSEVAYWFDKSPGTTSHVYRFYPTTFTPDHRRIWFERRRWYKRGRHPSRVQ